MAGRDIVVVGASAGGIEAVSELVRGLDPDFPGSIFIVVHFPGNATSTLPNILGRAGPLPTAHAIDGQPIEPGRIYVAKPGSHLLIKNNRILLTRGPKENGSRPALDPLFRSAARTYGPRVVGVVLSGNLNDGTAGLLAIKRRGGVGIAQSVESSLYGSMPRSAIEKGVVDHVLAPAEIAALLNQLALQATEPLEVPLMSDDIATNDPAEEVAHADRHVQAGLPSPMSCPECHGVLWETKHEDLVHFRCRVGHAYSAEALLVHQSEYLEAALWTALRALEEHSALAKRLANQANGRGHVHSASSFTEQAMDAEHHASVIRNVLHAGIRIEDIAEPAAVAAD